MATEHVDIADPDIHEPKGVAAASANTVYVADGAGSGTWEHPDETVIDYADVLSAIQDDIDDGDLDLNGQITVLAVIPDVSTADSVLVPVLKNCVFKRARCTLAGGITTADAIVSFKNAAGSDMGTALTVAEAGSTKGTGFTFTATANNTITGPSWIEVATDGASTVAQALYILLEFTGTLN